MKQNGKPILFVLLVLFFLFSACVYTVNERNVAIEKFLGRIKLEENNRPVIQEPGLHFKLPVLTTVVTFDTRLQTLVSDSEKIPTKEQKFVIVDYFVKWKIRDFYQYYISTSGNYQRVMNLLKPKVSDSLRAEFGKKTIEEVVTEDRVNIMSLVRDVLREKAEASLGLEIVDMRIKRIDLEEGVKESVYDRMRTKRKQVANDHRFKGQQKSEEIRSEADFNAKKIIAEAKRTAEITRGEADAEAASIYSKAYSQDPEFYQFYRSLGAYSEVFNDNNDMLVLSPDSEFFKYFLKQNSKG